MPVSLLGVSMLGYSQCLSHELSAQTGADVHASASVAHVNRWSQCP